MIAPLVALSTGMIAVVPQDTWHRREGSERVCVTTQRRNRQIMSGSMSRTRDASSAALRLTAVLRFLDVNA
jgi:hypothetical protein